MKRRIGLLTPGGDVCGLNAVIEAVVKAAHKYDIEVFGYLNGYEGMVHDRGKILTLKDVEDIRHKGGTILGASKGPSPKAYPIDGKKVDMHDKILNDFKAKNIDSVIITGGDGSMREAKDLCEMGVKTIGVVKTIDNDVEGIKALGYDTGTQALYDYIGHVKTTALSHSRVMVVEAMGATVGWLALRAGLASGAHAILIPEMKLDMDELTEFVNNRVENGKRFTLIVVAEGIKLPEAITPAQDDPHRTAPVLKGAGQYIEKELNQRLKSKFPNLEIRSAVPGHFQRGGSTLANDIERGLICGAEAVNCLMRDEYGFVISYLNKDIEHIPFDEIVGRAAVPEHHPIVDAVRSLGVFMGQHV